MPDKETKKLFDEDGYADSFEAKVLAVRKDIEKKNTAQKTAENQQRVKEERTAKEERITEERITEIRNKIYSLFPRKCSSYLYE